MLRYYNTFITTATLLVLILSYSLSDSHATKLCVAPSDPSPCPCKACHTFDYYLNNSEIFFVDDTTFFFLPGYHRVKNVYNGHSVSGLNFTGNNATLLILNMTSLWFSLNHSSFISFSGLTVNSSSSFPLIFLNNVSHVELIDIEINGICDIFCLINSGGFFHIHNLTIRSVGLCKHVGWFKYMTGFENISGTINISNSIYHYLGSKEQFTIGVVVHHNPVGTAVIGITDSQFNKVGIEVYAFTEKNIVLLMENVLVDGSYMFGVNFWNFGPGPTNVTIINCNIMNILNGTALDLTINSSLARGVIKNTQLSCNYGDYTGLIIEGTQYSQNAVVELDNVTIESNDYLRGATTMIIKIHVMINNCSFRNNTGTAIFLDHSHLLCYGHNEFIGNIAYEGAGIYINW